MKTYRKQSKLVRTRSIRDDINEIVLAKSKNEGGDLALDGVVKDMTTMWETCNMLNACSNGTSFFMNSPGSQFSNDVQPNGVKRKIIAEFLFFDKMYWTTRERAQIQLYFSGHGD